MSKQQTLVVSALFTLFLIGCGGDTETSSTKAPALSSVDANERSAGGDTASARLEKNEQAEEAEPANGSSSTASDVASAGNSGSATNGLFPNMPMMDKSGVAFGGGLFPDFQPSDEGMSEVAAKMGETYPSGAEATKEMAGEMSKEMASENDGSDSTEAVAMASKAAPASLLPKAMKLFTEHADQDAIDVIYANYLVSDTAREQYGLDWYPGLKEPRMLFRWGVGIVFNKPRELAGRHPVIGDPGDPDEGVEESDRPRGGGGRRGGIGGASGAGLAGGGRSRRSGSRTYQNIDTSRPDGYLMYYTGDFGEQLISFLDSRRQDDEPYYGQILKDVMEQKMEAEESEQVASNNSNNSSGRGVRDNSAANLGGAPIGGAGRGRNTRGRTPRNNSQPLQREDTSVLDRAMGQAVATKPTDDASGSILPGVTLLGVGSKADIVERAKAANLDGLLVFTVKVSKSRGGGNSRNRTSSPPEFSCATGLKIVDIASGDNVFSSKMLKDTKVEEENEDGKDPVKQQVERAFATFADDKFRAQDLPSGLNEDVIKNRVGRILKNNKDQPLAAAVEIISYHQSELLSTELAETAISRLFGSDDAKVLVDGDASARIEFLKSALPNVGSNLE